MENILKHREVIGLALSKNILHIHIFNTAWPSLN
jgi:hypothetical protein